jgi:hypothetical protein
VYTCAEELVMEHANTFWQAILEGGSAKSAEVKGWYDVCAVLTSASCRKVEAILGHSSQQKVKKLACGVCGSTFLTG